MSGQGSLIKSRQTTVVARFQGRDSKSGMCCCLFEFSDSVGNFLLKLSAGMLLVFFPQAGRGNCRAFCFCALPGATFSGLMQGRVVIVKSVILTATIADDRLLT